LSVGVNRNKRLLRNTTKWLYL